MQITTCSARPCGFVRFRVGRTQAKTAECLALGQHVEPSVGVEWYLVEWWLFLVLCYVSATPLASVCFCGRDPGSL